MSSSKSPPATVEIAAPDLQTLLTEKDEEIASLKKEIVALQKQVQDQQAELEGKKTVNASVAGIAKKSLKHVSNSNGTTTKMEARWKARFQQLVAYKLQHGDCNVAKSYQDKSLHSWVRTQREGKKAFDAGNTKGCSMTQERVDALNSIGFQWVLGHQPNDVQWDGMFQSLMQYKQQHGHTRVSASDDKKLYKWVLNQRARRRLLESKGEGKAKGMTWARVEKLSAIDFCWEATNRTRNTIPTTPVPHFGAAAPTTIAAAQATAATAGWVRPSDHPPEQEQQQQQQAQATRGSGGGGVGDVLEAAARATVNNGNDKLMQYKTYEA